MVKQSLSPDIPVVLGTETDARYIASFQLFIWKILLNTPETSM